MRIDQKITSVLGSWQLMWTRGLTAIDTSHNPVVVYCHTNASIHATCRYLEQCKSSFHFWIVTRKIRFQRYVIKWKIFITSLYLGTQQDGFGSLVVSMLTSGTQVCGFKPDRSRWIFTGIKILSMPSSGGEVKESVPCPSFAACKRT